MLFAEDLIVKLGCENESKIERRVEHLFFLSVLRSCRHIGFPSVHTVSPLVKIPVRSGRKAGYKSVIAYLAFKSRIDFFKHGGNDIEYHTLARMLDIFVYRLKIYKREKRNGIIYSAGNGKAQKSVSPKPSRQKYYIRALIIVP